MAKPNYRHQKKQKELARKVRHAEKQKKRLSREEEAQQDNLASVPAAPIATAVANPIGSDGGVQAGKA